MMGDKKVFALVDCSIPINNRNQKIINSLREHYKDVVIHVITWNRENIQLENDPYFHAYDKVAAYADVKAKLHGLMGFKKYIKSVLVDINPDVIIASHWSNLILVAGSKKKDQILIYENLDIPTGPFPLRFLEKMIEKWCLRKVDLIIHASRFFRPLYKQSIHQIILENKPAFKPSRKESAAGSPLKIAFVGSVRYQDILKNLSNAIMNNSNFELYFHGSGEDLDVMKQYCKGANNVIFTGKYDYSKVVSLYHQSDVIWAGYPNKDYNVIYAISNKFHESLYVGVPCVYSEKTALANFVKTQNIGLVVNPYDSGAIKDLFEDIISGKVNLEAIKQSMKDFQEKESSWDDDFMQVLNFLKG